VHLEAQTAKDEYEKRIFAEDINSREFQKIEIGFTAGVSGLDMHFHQPRRPFTMTILPI
jgi:hypothetical protein